MSAGKVRLTALKVLDIENALPSLCELEKVVNDPSGSDFAQAVQRIVNSAADGVLDVQALVSLGSLHKKISNSDVQLASVGPLSNLLVWALCSCARVGAGTATTAPFHATCAALLPEGEAAYSALHSAYHDALQRRHRAHRLQFGRVVAFQQDRQIVLAAVALKGRATRTPVRLVEHAHSPVPFRVPS